MTSPTLAHVPLDERPVNTQLVADVAAVAGATVALPPDSMLPHFRTPADTEALGRWVADTAGESEHLIVALDTLVHGGLIPARTTHTPLIECLTRLESLRGVRSRHPRTRISAVSLVTRASDSYSNVEEPEYWSHHGRGLHAWGGATHSGWSQSGPTSDPPDVPHDVLSDFAGRRLRNHQVTLAALQQAWDGVIDDLVITADDTATWSAGSAEQQLIDYWNRLARSSVPVYPGADETGAILAARALVGDDAPIRVTVATAEPEGLLRVPPYENAPLGQSIERQVAVARGVRTDASQAELVLAVHGPDPECGDQYAAQAPATDLDAAIATAALVERLVDAGTPVALADVRFANGADPLLVEELSRRSVLDRLAAYAGWNTAGNALGSAVALGVATAVGVRRGTWDESAARIALARRILDDYSYQAVVRREQSSALFDDSVPPVPHAQAREAEARLTALLQQEATRLGLAAHVTGVTLPWDRAFEVRIELD